MGDHKKKTFGEKFWTIGADPTLPRSDQLRAQCGQDTNQCLDEQGPQGNGNDASSCLDEQAPKGPTMRHLVWMNTCKGSIEAKPCRDEQAPKKATMNVLSGKEARIHLNEQGLLPSPPNLLMIYQSINATNGL